jgi:AraC-like DNA-binding protein
MRIGPPIDENTENLSRVNRYVHSGSVVFGEVLYEKRGTCGPRVQADYQLVVILRGSARIEQSEGTLEVAANHAVLLIPGRKEFFQFSTSERTFHSWCAVRPDLINLEGTYPQVQVAPLSSRIFGLIDAGLELNAATEEGQSLIQSLGLSCLRSFLYETSQGQVADKSSPYSQAIEILDRRLAEPWTVARLAEAVGVSTQHLIRLFRQHGQTSPARFLWDARTRRGVELLRETGLSVSQVSEQVGFSSPFHFARLVKQAYGASPRDLRRMAWKGENV